MGSNAWSKLMAVRSAWMPQPLPISWLRRSDSPFFAVIAKYIENNGSRFTTCGYPRLLFFHDVVIFSVIVHYQPIFRENPQFLKGDDHAADLCCRDSGTCCFFSWPTALENVQIRSKSGLWLWVFRMPDAQQCPKTGGGLPHVQAIISLPDIFPLFAQHITVGQAWLAHYSFRTSAHWTPQRNLP